jgi:uncharacterized protein (DUF2164 family)
MTIKIDNANREQALASLQKYFSQNFDEPLGALAAGSLLDFVLREIGPLAYNQAIRDAQERMASRVADLDGEIHEDEFQYWLKAAHKR